MQTLPFEIFDKFGRFVMPTAEQIAGLDTDTRDRFAAVQAASVECEAATATRKAAEQKVSDAIAERDASEKDLRRLRPPLSAVANAKEFIASERQ